MDRVMVGDSITQWNPRKDLINLGLAGEATRDILWRIDEIVEVARCRRIYIMMGINDILLGVPLEKIIKNYIEVVARLREVARDVVIISTIPIYGDINRNVRVGGLNSILYKYAKEVEVGYLDVVGLLGEAGELKKEYTTDGVHLNTYGYERLNSSF